MATQCKLYRNSPQIILPQTWTFLTFEKAIRNDLGMATDLSFIVPPENGDFIWSRNIRWQAFSVTEGDVRPRQFMSRFLRVMTEDDTGSSDHPDTPGRDWETVTWQFFGYAEKPVGVQVWHDHDEPLGVEHAQFVGTTWDY